MRQPAAEMAHDGLRELDKADRDPAPVHDFTGEHEEGQRHQRKTVYPIVKVAIEDGEVTFGSVQNQKKSGRQKKAEHNRQTDHEKKEKGRKEPNQHAC